MRFNAKRLAMLGCATVMLTLLVATSAQASDEHLFDQVLSLRGSCATNAEDETPDPGLCPGTLGVDHPSKPFERPCGSAADPHGDIYVANPDLTITNEFGPNGRIDVFDPQGRFLAEIGNEYGPCSIAVDSKGNVYTLEKENRHPSIRIVDRYEPNAYPPVRGTTTYSLVDEIEFPDTIENFCPVGPTGIAVDPSNDHLYVGRRCWVEEFGSAEEGSPLLSCCIGESAAEGALDEISGVAVYGANHDVYVAETANSNQGTPARIMSFSGIDGHTKCVINGTGSPGGEFDFVNGTAIAVDQSNGDFYVYDYGQNAVEQFGASEGCPEYIGKLDDTPRQPTINSPYVGLSTDTPCRTGVELTEPCSGAEAYDSPDAGNVYLTAGTTAANSHLFAFKLKQGGPPEIRNQAVSGITETEAVLEGEVNPDALDTTYHVQYTTQAAFEEHGYEGALSVPASDVDAGSGGGFRLFAEPVAGLEPDTAYRFRFVASNCEDEKAEPESCLTLGEGKPGEEGEDAGFSTFAPPTAFGPCANASLRTGASSGLPDCRAYELVTPANTNGRIPNIARLGNGFGQIGFDTRMASPNGESVVFGSVSGALPKLGGGGDLDTYEALRDPSSGWQSRFTGLDGAQAQIPVIGGISSDHGYAFWGVENASKGSLAVPSTDRGNYLHVPSGVQAAPNCAVEAEPEGRFEWIGCGSLGNEPEPAGLWISPGGSHVIFETGNNAGHPSTPVQLEPCAPPTGIRAIYDRTPGGPTRCVSLPPAGASTETEASFQANSPAYLGTSADGSVVAFSVLNTFYARVNDAETVEVATGNLRFGGISSDGRRIFYMAGGNIFACDLGEGGCAGEGAHPPIAIGEGGESTLVNVSADGSHAYFVSPLALTEEEENGWGAKATPGADNLYAWDGNSVRFVTVLDAADVDSEFVGDVSKGLGEWVPAAVGSPSGNSGPANDPSRSNADGGGTLVFESRAALTDYDSGGHSEIYRYDATAEAGSRLTCLSCDPTGAAPRSDALLESTRSVSVAQPFPPVGSLTHIDNVSADGREVFFQSGDRLVPADVDGYQDVYEWEEEGTGGCQRDAGCLSLISGGRSSGDDYLYAMTPDGHDVFFLSGDPLVAQDPDKTPSIYDARVDGGFPPPVAPPGECLGEACQPAVTAPSDATPATSSHEGPGNPVAGAKRSCPKGKRKLRRAGKSRCVKSSAKKARHHKRSHDNRRAQR
jgi:hypothetical protein